jgi:hypothetical protein
MHPFRVLYSFIGVAALFAGAPCAAAPADTLVTTYALVTPPSSLQVGCQGPCACPIVTFPTFGSFVLVRTGADPLYTYYAVERYIASFNNGPGAVAITGSGQYRVGGEVARLQQLTLELQVQGQPVQHFDSGLQPVRASFPALDISCAVHGFFCEDSVLVVNAKPVSTAGTHDADSPTGLRSVLPNPFRDVAEIAFTLARPERVELTVVDVAGRRVRSLVAGQLEPAGPRTIAWEGRRDDGSSAPAGIYWALLSWPGGRDRRRISKLD